MSCTSDLLTESENKHGAQPSVFREAFLVILTHTKVSETMAWSFPTSLPSVEILISSALRGRTNWVFKALKPQSPMASHLITVWCLMCSQLVPSGSKCDMHHSALPSPPLNFCHLQVYSTTGNHLNKGQGPTEEVHMPCSQVERPKTQSSGANQRVETRRVRQGQQGRHPWQAQKYGVGPDSESPQCGIPLPIAQCSMH